MKEGEFSGKRQRNSVKILVINRVQTQRIKSTRCSTYGDGMDKKYRSKRGKVFSVFRKFETVAFSAIDAYVR